MIISALISLELLRNFSGRRIISMEYKLSVLSFRAKCDYWERKREKETSLRKTRTSPRLTMYPMNTRLVSGLMNLIFNEISHKRAGRVNALPPYQICGIDVLFATCFLFRSRKLQPYSTISALFHSSFLIFRRYFRFFHIATTLLFLYCSFIAEAYEYLISNSEFLDGIVK